MQCAHGAAGANFGQTLFELIVNSGILVAIVVPPEFWFHQHFNAGNMPARYLALRAAGRKFKGLRKLYGVDEDVKKGGSQMEYDEEFRGYRRRWLPRCRSSSNTRPSLPFDPMVLEERS